MRIAVQALSDFGKKQYLETLESMVIYRDTLKKSNRSQFNIALNEVIKNERAAELDGMQMRMIENALNHRAIKEFEKGNVLQGINFRILAAKIRTKLVSYQELYGPKIKKETACAPTQTA